MDLKTDLKIIIEKALANCKTKSELSRQVGVHWATIYRWVQGINKPNYKQFINLLEIATNGKRELPKK